MKITMTFLILLFLLLGFGEMVANDPLWFLRKSLWTRGVVWFNELNGKNEPFFWQKTDIDNLQK